MSAPRGDAVVILPPGSGTAYGFGRQGVDLVNALRRQGFHPVPVDLDNPRNLDQMLSARTSLIYSFGGWVAQLGRRVDDATVPVLDTLDIPVVMRIHDAPVCLRMIKVLEQPAARKYLLHIDPVFADYSARHFPGTHLWHGTGVDLVERPPVEPNKDIGLLFVGTFRDPTGMLARLQSVVPKLARLVGDLHEAALWDWHRSFLSLAEAACRAHGVPFDLTNRILTETLCELDQIIRNERRARVLERLARVPVTVVTNALPAGLALHPDSTVLPPCSLPEMLALLRRARATVLCAPNHSHQLNERIVFAMACGTAVAATPSAAIDRDLMPGRDLLVFDPATQDFAETAERLADPRQRQALLEAAEAALPRFSVDSVVGGWVRRLEQDGCLSA